MKLWDQFLKPVVILCTICIVVTGALALTNGQTDPVIKKAAIEAADNARYELFPEAFGFTMLAYDGEGVSNVYAVDGNGGAIITSTAKGYGGGIIVMVAFEPDGSIRRVKIQEQTETAGLGTKIENESFWGQYTGLTGNALGLGDDISAISGATISSRAVNNAVNSALAAYHELF